MGVHGRELKLSKDAQKYFDNVVSSLNKSDEESELVRANPFVLLGSGKTLDQLPPPPSEQVLWNRKHKNHYQYFLILGRDECGDIMVWGCMDCRVPEPDALNKEGDWKEKTRISK